MGKTINSLCLKLIYCLYITGKFLGIAPVTYSSNENKLKQSKLLRNISIGFRGVITLALVLFIMTAAINGFKVQTVIFGFYAYTTSTTLLLIVIQIKDGYELIEVINEFLTLNLELKPKKGVSHSQQFGSKFFVMLLTKMATVTYISVSDIPEYLQQTGGMTVVFCLTLTFIWTGTLIFFNIAFLGLMMASEFQSNMFQYLESCWMLKDLEEYSQLSVKFYKVFHKFIRLARAHFLVAFIFYTLSIGLGLSFVVSIGFQNIYKTIGNAIYYSCFIMDVLLFNMAAEFVEKNSYRRNFTKVDILSSDSKQVGLTSN